VCSSDLTMALAVRLEQPKVRIAAHNCDLKLILIPIINVVVIVSYNGANIQLFFKNKDDNQKKLYFFSSFLSFLFFSQLSFIPKIKIYNVFIIFLNLFGN